MIDHHPEAIRLDAVGVRFRGRAGVDAVRAVTAGIPTGRFTAILGPNGSGKSTLLRAIARIHPPTSGHVEILGRDAAGYGRRELARAVSLLPQRTSAPDGLSVLELVQRGRHPHQTAFGGGGPRDAAAVDAAIAKAGIGALAERELTELSGGQRQRAWLAMALAQEAPILLLDEPTTYLDLAAQHQLLDLCAELADAGRTVVAVLHDLQQAATYADHVLLMAAGELAGAGTPREVLDADRVERVFGIACRVDLDDPSGPVIAPLPRGLRDTASGS